MVADVLSRPTPPEDTIVNTFVDIVSVDLPAYGPLATREEQLKNPDLRKILETIGQPKATSDQGVLYRYSPDTDQEEAQLVISKDKRLELLKNTHGAPTAGHRGAERTLQRIQRLYYWPGIRRDIYEYVKKYGACQRYTAATSLLDEDSQPSTTLPTTYGR